jgi:uncharacterized protein (TIGR03083 family)
MTGARAGATLSGGVALLERAIGYTLGQLSSVTPAALAAPTPCREWNLGALLAHLDDSLAALQEAMALRHIGPESPYPGPGKRTGAVPGPAPGTGLEPGPGCTGADASGPPDAAATLVAGLRGRACRLLGALAGAREHLVWVGGYPVPASIVTSAGAVDIAVHGWDVAWACGTAAPIPGQLAEEMLGISSLLVTRADRPELFTAPVPVPPQASASDRLIAYLGRNPVLA